MIRATDIDGIEYQFDCGQWALMSPASQSDWTIIENTCGYQTSVGSPYAASDFLFTLGGVIVAAFPLSISVSNGVYTIGVDPNSDLGAVEALDGTGIAVRTADDTWALRTLTSGTGISLTNADGVAGNPQITNTAPDQVVALTPGAGITVGGTYPNFTITNSAPDQVVALTAGAGISITGTYPNFTITNTVTAYTDEQAQDAVGGILTDSATIDFTYDDAGGTITAIVKDASISTAKLIDDAVTYAKLQNVAANNVVLGRVSGAGGNAEELTVAQLYTLLGLTGVANRFALWTGTNALTSNAAYTFDAAAGRMTVTGTATGVGANSGFLNLNSGALGAATTFLRASGNVSSNMIGEFVNANNSTVNANTLFTLSVGGSAAGDPVLQFTVSGAVTHSVGTDNSDGDKFKITTNSATPGGNANASLVITNAATPFYGFNVDAPGREHDFGGVLRAKQLVLQNAVPTTTIDPAGGLGTGASLSIEGCNNGFRLTINTGTAPVANAALFTITFLQTFTTANYFTYSPGNNATANEIVKFVYNGFAPGTIRMRANGTLTASTTYVLIFSGVGL